MNRIVRSAIFPLLSGLFWTLSCFRVSGQQVTILQEPVWPDSSLYDIVRIDENHFLACGENGALLELEGTGKVKHVNDFPGKDINLLNMLTIGDSMVLIGGEYGWIFRYYPGKGQWESTRIPGLRHRAIYTIVQHHDTIFIAGGANRIARGKRTIPRGFIFYSADGGQNWEKSRLYPGRFVWCLKETPSGLYVSTYSPFGTQIFHRKQGKWKKWGPRTRFLLHDLRAGDQNVAGFGGKFSWNGGRGVSLILPEKNIQLDKPGFLWSIDQKDTIALITASKGRFHYRLAGNQPWQTVNTGISTNFYQGLIVDSTQLLIIGQSGLILSVTGLSY